MTGIDFMTRRGVLGLLASAGALLAGCELIESSGKYRFRMTVEVMTPQGLKTGSGVMAVSAREIIKTLPDEGAGSGGILGEAVVVDLADGPIFVLLTIPDAAQPLDVEVTHALAPAAPLDPVRNYVAAVRSLGQLWSPAKADLPRASWPMMVRFRDINDPKTVERVDPDAVGVKRIALETTSDAATTGIQKRFPAWFSDLIRRRLSLSGKSMDVIKSNELADTMGPASFGTEIK